MFRFRLTHENPKAKEAVDVDDFSLTPQFKGGPALVTGHLIPPDTRQGTRCSPGTEHFAFLNKQRIQRTLPYNKYS